MLCLGCGTDLTSKVTDRRALDNPDNSDAADVVKVWKSFVLDDAVGVDVDAVGAIFNGSDKRRVPKMCPLTDTANDPPVDHPPGGSTPQNQQNTSHEE